MVDHQALDERLQDDLSSELHMTNTTSTMVNRESNSSSRQVLEPRIYSNRLQPPLKSESSASILSLLDPSRVNVVPEWDFVLLDDAEERGQE